MKNVNETTKKMTKSLCTLALALISSATGFSQSKKADTVIVELAKTSKVIFTIKDKTDLPTLKAYDYQALFNDILAKIEAQDTTLTEAIAPIEKERKEDWATSDSNEEDANDEERKGFNRGKRYRSWGSSQSTNFDIGMNNFLSDGKFPDEANAPYAVRPWGSWYVGINSIQKIRIAGKFFTELGLGVSWYNFKFQDDGTIMSKGVSQVDFTQSPAEVNPVKSKLTVCYVNASFIPVVDFGSRPHKSRFWGSNDAFRIGLGPYVGYRIDSYTKQVYELNGNEEKDRTRNNYYLNNLRYGARFQVGYRGTDLFVNYDMNELFAENRGPKLNAFSFGVIF